MQDQYIQKWFSLINNSSGCNNYRLFKTEFKKSEYFNILSKSMSRQFLSFRTRNHRFPVEKGRWQGIPLSERKCLLCSEDIGDEFHYVLSCKHFLHLRKQFIKPYYYKHPNVLKYNELMNLKNGNKLKNLCIFIGILLKEIR